VKRVMIDCRIDFSRSRTPRKEARKAEGKERKKKKEIHCGHAERGIKLPAI